ncbi:MAG: 30S ribosomal protein S16 [Patescibacteria group bacterium]
MLKIRLQRVGRKNEPSFRLVLTDSKNGPKSGKSLEVLGSFDSRRAEQATFDVEKIKHWMSKGVQVSDTVHNLLVTRKVIAGKKINVLPLKRPIKKEGDAAASAPVAVAEAPAASAEAPVAEAPVAEAAQEASIESAPAEPAPAEVAA